MVLGLLLFDLAEFDNIPMPQQLVQLITSMQLGKIYVTGHPVFPLLPQATLNLTLAFQGNLAAQLPHWHPGIDQPWSGVFTPGLVHPLVGNRNNPWFSILPRNVLDTSARLAHLLGDIC